MITWLKRYDSVSLFLVPDLVVATDPLFSPEVKYLFVMSTSRDVKLMLENNVLRDWMISLNVLMKPSMRNITLGPEKAGASQELEVVKTH